MPPPLQAPLASPSEVAAVQHYLAGQGYTNISLQPSSCSNFTYILCGPAPAQAEAAAAAAHSNAASSAANGVHGSSKWHQLEPALVVVPVSSKASNFSMGLMVQVMQGLPGALLAARAGAPAAANDAPDPTATGSHGSSNGGSRVATAAAAAAVAAPGVPSSDCSSNIRLAIVNGTDVVQVQLFNGVQPPSESY